MRFNVIMRKLILLTAILLSLVSLSGCRSEADELYSPEDRTASTLTEQFDAFWSGMQQSYVFWSDDDTDWESIRAKYRPKFVSLDREKYVSTDTVAKLYNELSATLLDHHLNIRGVNPKAAPGKNNIFSVYPAVAEVEKRDYYHPKLTDEDFQKTYARLQAEGRLSQWHNANAYTSSGDMQVTSGLIDGDILYLRVSQFAVISLVDEFPDYKDDTHDNPKALEARQFFIEKVTAPETNLRGVIIDLRNNPGGFTTDLSFLFAYLTPEPLRLGKTRTKSGLHPLAYSAWIPFEIAPAPTGTLPSDIPVTALCDIWSCSLAELFTQAVMMLPNGQSIGERTFGCTGPLVYDYRVAYTGSFSTSDNKLTVHTSTWQMRMGPELKLFEGVGVTPDHLSLLKADSGFSQLEDAINLTRQK